MPLNWLYAPYYLKYKLFTECHQHSSVVRPHLIDKNPFYPKNLFYFISRTIPGKIINKFTSKCFPIAPDCAMVAYQFYGVSKEKIHLIPIGTDTDIFYPVDDANTSKENIYLRKSLGFQASDILCVYSGRFSNSKNPLLLARSIVNLQKKGLPFNALFIGDGIQKKAIESCQGCKVISFVKYDQLPRYFRAADIGVWPTQESVSMLDALACGIPVIASSKIGDPYRIEGNGKLYNEGDIEHLTHILEELYNKNIRIELGKVGRQKMLSSYSWVSNAKKIIDIYMS